MGDSSVDLWGPPTWNFLHTIALTYPGKAGVSDIQNMASMLHSLTAVIPCPRCREHYSLWVKNVNGHLGGRDDLFNALNHFHNEVNTRTHKPTLTIEQAHAIHGNFASGSVCPSSNTESAMQYRIVVFAVVICLIIGIASTVRVRVRPPVANTEQQKN